MTPRLTQITPMVPVSNLAKSVEFFTELLGFTCPFIAGAYAFLRRDAVAIRLIEVGPEIDLTDERQQVSCYIDVAGIDALYASMKPALDRLPEGRVRAPFDQSYGQREFHVIDEDALLIFFGEGIASASS